MQSTSLGDEGFCEFTPLCIHSFKSLCSQGPGHGMEERMGISHSGASGFWSRYEKEGEKRQKSDVTKGSEPHLEGTPRDQGVYQCCHLIAVLQNKHAARCLQM